MRANTLAVVVCILASGCGDSKPKPPRVTIPPDSVLITVTNVIPEDFAGGKAGGCLVLGEITNTSKDRVTDIRFDLAGVAMNTGVVHANDKGRYELGKQVGTQDSGTSEDKSTSQSCSVLARRITNESAAVKVLDCNMENVAEGICQKRAIVISRISDQDVKDIEKFETAAVKTKELAEKLQSMPLPDAMSYLQQNVSDATIADFVIRTDAREWFMNRYAEISVTDVSRKENEAASAFLIHASFRYIGGNKGWVNITLYKDPNQIPCVEFWDDAGSCRPLRIPDKMKIAAPVATEASAQASTSGSP